MVVDNQGTGTACSEEDVAADAVASQAGVDMTHEGIIGCEAALGTREALDRKAGTVADMGLEEQWLMVVLKKQQGPGIQGTVD